MTHMIVHAEGRADIGYGYLARTGVLAEFALNSGGSVTYVTKTPEPVGQMCSREVEIISLAQSDIHGAFLDWLSETRPDVVVTDSYNIGTGNSGH